MSENASEKIRLQFESYPYPNVPLQVSPSEDTNSLFIHNLVTSRYLRDQSVISTEGRTILEAGCGSGYSALILALANPGARIVAVDLSQNSIQIAKDRLHHHGFQNFEFHVMNLENLPQLEMQFDYINCDEVLYLLPDPLAGLRAMKKVLKPDGIIRTNLHSRLQRDIIYRAQDAFRLLGLFEGNPSGTETAAVRETMESLYDPVNLKQTWNAERAAEDQWILSNYLIHGDQGYTILDLFYFLQEADLEFISMVHWQTWNLQGLFKQIPEFVNQKLMQIPIYERLHLFELIHPIHRLLDFWCGHPNSRVMVPPEKWTDVEWQNTTVSLHPQLQTEERKQELLRCIHDQQSFLINERLTDFDPFWVESNLAACLLLLWNRSQSVASLVERWLKIRPVDPVTMQPHDLTQAFESIKKLLIDLEFPGFLMLSQSNA